VVPPSQYNEFLDNLDDMLNTVELEVKTVLPEDYKAMKHELSLEKFYSLLNTIHTNSQGQTYLRKEFRDAVNKIMPDELKTGKFRKFGKLLIEIEKKLLPIFENKKLKVNQHRQINQGIFDIIETTSHLIKLINDDLEKDKSKIAETSEILNIRIHYLYKFT